MKKGLTPKQEIFAQSIFAGMSQRESYRLAYPKSKSCDKSVDTLAYLLNKEKCVSERIAELREEQTERSGWRLEKLLAKFEEIGDKCLKEEEVIDRNGNHTGEYRFDSSGANKAYENIGKLLGLYTEKLQHSGIVGVQIIDDISYNEDEESDGEE